MKVTPAAFSLVLLVAVGARAQESLYVRVVGRWDITPESYAVDVSGGHAYLGHGSSALYAISVADPTHPVEVGHYGAYCARALAVAGGYAYVANYDTGLQVI